MNIPVPHCRSTSHGRYDPQDKVPEIYASCAHNLHWQNCCEKAHQPNQLTQKTKNLVTIEDLFRMLLHIHHKFWKNNGAIKKYKAILAL